MTGPAATGKTFWIITIVLPFLYAPKSDAALFGIDDKIKRISLTTY